MRLLYVVFMTFSDMDEQCFDVSFMLYCVMCIYIYIEREREKYVYIYIYRNVCIFTYIHTFLVTGTRVILPHACLWNI
jgi:hypothetical protein